MEKQERERERVVVKVVVVVVVVNEFLLFLLLSDWYRNHERGFKPGSSSECLLEFDNRSKRLGHHGRFLFRTYLPSKCKDKLVSMLKLKKLPRLANICKKLPRLFFNSPANDGDLVIDFRIGFDLGVDAPVVSLERLCHLQSAAWNQNQGHSLMLTL